VGRLTRAGRNIAWIEQHCVVPEGKDIGKPVKLRSGRRPISGRFTTTRPAPNGDHQLREEERENIARGLFAAAPFVRPGGDPEHAAAEHGSISRAGCGPVQAGGEDRPDVADLKRSGLVIRDTVKQIFCPELGTLYKALSAEASTAHGQSPIFAIHDELGQVRGPSFGTLQRHRKRDGRPRSADVDHHFHAGADRR
jgi:hypothetical protein